MSGLTKRTVGGLLAGGRSQRMGRDKAALRWDGTSSMAEASLAALAPLCDVVFALGHGAWVPDGIVRLPDARPDAGPLAGVESLLAQNQAVDVFIVTCDMPLVTSALLRALPAPPPRGVSVFDDGSGDTEPFPMRLDAGAFKALQNWLDSGRHDVRGFVGSLPRRTVKLERQLSARLLNVNRQQDLEQARMTARHLQATEAPRAIHEKKDTAVSVAVLKLRDEHLAQTSDLVAQEEPLELRIANVPIAVVMRTPGHDEDLALGFLRTEGMISSATELRSLQRCTEIDDATARENVISATLREDVELDLGRLQRNFFVGSSCGVCGKATIDEAMRKSAPLGPPIHRWNMSQLIEFPTRMRRAQTGFHLTGGLHAAALFAPEGTMLVAREDVGRHNAVDKVAGWMSRRDEYNIHDVALVVSGRISFEIVQKALAIQIGLIVAVSAPTSLAVAFAKEAGITLVGFARDASCNVYTVTERIQKD